MHIDIAGEVRCVVTKADGTVKEDTGFQKNLILNQGLDFFGGGKGSTINTSCAIGSGNSAPTITQTVLDAYIAQANGTDTTSDYSYEDKGDNQYRIWEQKKYRFTGLNGVNISEVGLVSTGTTSTNYYLTTRALIKDSSGNPISISVLGGETLDIYYKIFKVIDTSDKAFVINVLDGSGGGVPYNVVIRPSYVGVSNRNAVSSALGKITLIGTYYGALGNITGIPLSPIQDVNITDTMPTYVQGSYKTVFTLSIGLNYANGALRCVLPFNFSFNPFQMRFGRVSDDAPLTKTNKDTLSIPLEYSWGRYEGVLE